MTPWPPGGPSSAKQLTRAEATGDVEAHQAHVGVLNQMVLRIVERAVVHGTVVEARLEDGALPGSARGVVKIGGLILAAAAPREIALNIAMFGPPAIPFEERLERVLDEPPVVEFLVLWELG